MNKNPNIPEIPLCLNVIRLQSYLLAPDEAILFDWFIVKQVSFKYQDFHYSQARIEAETRIKRTRQNVIINLFKDMGFLTSQVRENKITRGRVSYFKVDFEVLADKDVLSEIIDADKPLYKAFVKYLKYLSAEQKKALKPQKKDIFDADAAGRVYKKLNDVYEKRRVMYNNGELTSSKPSRLKVATQLPRNRFIEKKLVRLSQIYNDTAIGHAFAAYIDSVFKGESAPSNLMNYFLSYDDVNESFGVFDYSLNEFNLNYGRKA